MIYKKLRISLIFSKLVVSKLLISNHRMHNLYTKFVKILGICKQFSNNLVNEQGNIPRLNRKDWSPTFIPFAKARKRIETLFSQLTDQFMVIRNYAKITNGLFARIIGKISALTVSQYMNYINGKPIGRIKYALN